MMAEFVLHAAILIPLSTVTLVMTTKARVNKSVAGFLPIVHAHTPTERTIHNTKSGP